MLQYKFSIYIYIISSSKTNKNNPKTRHHIHICTNNNKQPQQQNTPSTKPYYLNPQNKSFAKINLCENIGNISP